MKKVLILTYCCLMAVFVHAKQSDASQQAHALYNDAEYTKAVEQYKLALEENQTSAALWYDLGNAYYKSGHMGYALAAYRKAAKLDPMDEDIRFNIAFVFAKTADKLEPQPKNLIVRLTDVVADFLTSGGWAFGAILLAILACMLFVVYIFMKNYTLKKIGFLSAILLWIGAFLFTALAMHRYYYALPSGAVIIAAHADILAEPNDNGTKLLMLHEGATLNLDGQEGEWVKVLLPNGTKGYIKAQAVEII